MLRNQLEILNRICHVGQSAFGREYIEQLMRNAACELGMQFALIGHSADDQQTAIETSLVINGQAVANNIRYELANTPCADVMSGGRVCIHKSDVARLYPQDVLLSEMGVESYAGAPIVSHTGELLGLAVLLDTKPIADTDAVSAILEFVAARIGLEIYREEARLQNLEEQENRIQRQKLEALGQLASGVAHDFNNVLCAILGHVELVRLQTDESAPAAHNLEIIAKTAQQAKGITKQLLDFANPARGNEVGDGRAGLELLNIKELLAHSTHRRMNLHIDLAAANDRVAMSRAHLQQVLMNLVVNANDAMPDGGRVWVTLANRDLAVGNYADGIAHGAYVEIRVRDEGVGIPEDVLSRIFEPFFTTKAADKGSGLGLATVFGLVKGAGGSINVNSQVGVGTEFVVLLPALPVPEEVIEKPATSKESALDDRPTVLVVEDEEHILEFLESIIDIFGYQTLSATCGAAALDHYSRYGDRIDCVVSDMNLPDMTGMAVIDKIFEHQPGMPVVLATGDSTSPELASLGSQPNIEFLEKPFEASVLQAALESFVDTTG